MTELLYLQDSYLKEFEATITGVEGRLVALDKTAFYPSGGGQPCDFGSLVGEYTYKVLSVKKISGQVVHEVDKEGLKAGDKIKGRIDWERRYKLMRAHTASHILSEVLFRAEGCLCTGNQLDIGTCREDISIQELNEEKARGFIAETNKIISKDLPIAAQFMPTEEALKIPQVCKLAKGLPPGLKELRIVSIGDFDIQADGGTHVKQTSEIGEIKYIGTENKGKNNRRLYFSL
ncbi:alanyl-tRNA editing protein [Candidatus Woesearchaeota archaeon]|nr:alanyl-tRNA editing protein [Candidatus Woesearchaeota archaeon]